MGKEDSRTNNSSNASHHQWYYFPHMKKSEALIFKQWDSEGSIQQKVANDLLENVNKRGNDDDHTRKMIEVIKKTSETKKNSSRIGTIESSNGPGNSDFCIHSAFEA